MAKKKKTPAKKTAITKDKKTLSHVKNAANSSQMKRLLDAVGGLGAIAGPTPAAKRSLRRPLGLGTPRRKAAVVAAYVGPPQRSWHFAPDRLRPPRPVPVEYRGGFACPCCAKQNGSPFFFMKRREEEELIGTSRIAPSALLGKPCGVFSKPYPENAYQTHLTNRHGFPSKSSKSQKESKKRKPGYGKGRGGNPINPGGARGASPRPPYVEVWVWVYGEGWQVQDIIVL